jgi:hypothetical protein
VSAYHVLVIEPLEDGSEMVVSVGPFTSWSFASAAAHRFRTKRDASGYTDADVKVRVAKQVAPEDFDWTPPSQRRKAEVIQLSRTSGKVRANDPLTSRQAALFMDAQGKSTSARQRLIEAHFAAPNGLTDEEAAKAAGLDLSSEYSTRCSELKRDGLLEDTDRTRAGSTGLQRTVRQLTAKGATYWTQQKAAK